MTLQGWLRLRLWADFAGKAVGVCGLRSFSDKKTSLQDDNTFFMTVHFCSAERNRAMWRKVDRMAGGKLKGCKERGEWAELYFMMQAAGLGMKVSRPFGSAGRYDVGVENPREGHQARVLRVQVKSTIYKRRNGEYSLNVMGPQRQKYDPGTVDYFAILLIPIDDWYIIPFEVMGRTNSSIHFTPKSKRQKYGEYREAWHLLRETGLTIQACVDPEWKGEAGSSTSQDHPADDPASLGMTTPLLRNDHLLIRNDSP
jgi:PD-(D/E)XK endonuclease